jgi:hypothetical protein
MNTEANQGGDEPAAIPETGYYLTVGGDGVVTQATVTNAPLPGWVEVEQAVYALAVPGRTRFVDGELETYDPPKPPTPTVIPKLELYRRMTDEEYEQMQAGVATQSARIQDVFRMVENFREDDTLWPLLLSMGHELYGPDRTAELLAPV